MPFIAFLMLEQIFRTLACRICQGKGVKKWPRRQQQQLIDVSKTGKKRQLYRICWLSIRKKKKTERKTFEQWITLIYCATRLHDERQHKGKCVYKTSFLVGWYLEPEGISMGRTNESVPNKNWLIFETKKSHTINQVIEGTHIRQTQFYWLRRQYQMFGRISSLFGCRC